jgi:hypothetical protein
MTSIPHFDTHAAYVPRPRYPPNPFSTTRLCSGPTTFISFVTGQHSGYLQSCPLPVLILVPPPRFLRQHHSRVCYPHPSISPPLLLIIPSLWRRETEKHGRLFRASGELFPNCTHSPIIVVSCPVPPFQQIQRFIISPWRPISSKPMVRPPPSQPRFDLCRAVGFRRWNNHSIPTTVNSS